MVNSKKMASIKSKIIKNFAVVLVVVISILLMSLVSRTTMISKYKNLINYTSNRSLIINSIYKDYIDISNDVIKLDIYSIEKDREYIERSYTNIISLYNDVLSRISTYNRLIEEDKHLKSEDYQIMMYDMEQFNIIFEQEYSVVINEIGQQVSVMDFEGLRRSVDCIDIYANVLGSLLQKMLIFNNANLEMAIADVENSEKVVNIVSATISIIGLIISLYLCMAVAKKITKPIVGLIESLNSISEGDLGIELQKSDIIEINTANENLDNLRDTINSLLFDIQKISEEIRNGSMSSKIDNIKYTGEYSLVVNKINELVEIETNIIKDVFNGILSIRDGNFDIKVTEYQGEQAFITEGLLSCKQNLQTIMKVIVSCINEIKNGNLKYRTDTSDYTGDWKAIIEDMNLLMENIQNPVNEVIYVLNRIQNGNLDNVITNEYLGDFNILKDSLNDTSSTLKSYTDNICEVLVSMADKNLDKLPNADYRGDFINVKNALNIILDSFNELINEIRAGIKQVAVGAQVISEQNMDLANGATKQGETVSSLVELSNKVFSGSRSIESNTEDVKGLANTILKDIEKCHQFMLETNSAMEEINEASNKITEVIKAIDDITFQINILALNAAVEAARAGEHGKGFAVVAEEVRNLANRSKSSATLTEELILVSNETAERGSEILNQATERITNVLSDIRNINDLIRAIASETKTQTESTQDIDVNLQHINEIVIMNTSISEEGAASSQELASQSDLINEALSQFITREEN